MGLFTDVVAPAIGATYQPWDNFWYQKIRTARRNPAIRSARRARCASAPSTIALG